MADHLTEGTALAGGLIAAATLDLLVKKNVLTLTEARDVLNSALRQVGIHSNAPGGFEAGRVIADIMRNRFPERRD